MLEQTRDNVAGAPLLAAARRIIPWFVLGVMVFWVFSMYTQYTVRQAAWDAEVNKPKPSQLVSATPAAAPAKKPAAAPSKPAGINTTSKVVIVSDVNFRKDPSDSSVVIRSLSTGEQLLLVGQVGSWYKVADSSGAVGWVSASQKFTKVVKQ